MLFVWVMSKLISFKCTIFFYVSMWPFMTIYKKYRINNFIQQGRIDQKWRFVSCETEN